MTGEDNNGFAGAPHELPVDGVLDLHTFRPRDVKGVVTDYLAACREKGVLEVRLIHGKGIGQLRQTVQALLAKLPDVASFSLASEYYGGSGATIVHLKPTEPKLLPTLNVKRKTLDAEPAKSQSPFVKS